jgi:hypothetical protein
MWREELAQGFLIKSRGQVTLPHRYHKLGILSLVGAGMLFAISPMRKAIAQIPTLPPTLLPPTIFPTNQTPTVNVPPLQPIPTSTPTPSTTFQPPERVLERASPTSPQVIEFGQPLPKTTPTDFVQTP